MSIETTKNITRTVLSSLLSTSYLNGSRLKIYPNTTLNQKFEILPSEGINSSTFELDQNKRCTIKCLVVGIKGHVQITGSDGIGINAPAQHRATDFSLFHHMPLAIKDIDSGEDHISVFTNRGKYCLRKEVVVAGRNYAYYYGLRISTSHLVPVTNLIHIESNNVVNTEEYVFADHPENLSPTPPDMPNNNLNIVTAEEIMVNSLLQAVFSADIAEEYMSAAEFLYGSREYAVISEIGVVTAFDHPMKLHIGNPSLSGEDYIETCAAQIITHLTSYNSLATNNGGITINMNLGVTEPILSTTSN